MIAPTFAVLVFTILRVGTTFAHSPANSERFHVEAQTNGEYAVRVGPATWLPSGPTFFNNAGKRYCSKEGNLKFLGFKSTQGYDQFGEWNRTVFTYNAGNLTVKTSIKAYITPALPVAIFSQTYSTTATKTKGKHPDDIISSFPSFRYPSEDALSLGYLSYGDYMAGWVNLNIGRWTASEANFTTGMKGGPLVLFDKSSYAMVISPFSKFMAASNKKFEDKHVSWGIMGLVDKVPADFSIDFIVYFSHKGVNEAMRGWGSYLTSFYKKTSTNRDSDLSLTHLGYWTDNGAYYYYNKEKGKNYEDTMLDTVAYLKAQGTPVRYLQIDSWFYTRGHVDGVRTWAPKREVFPHGFASLYNKTDLPLACHNRYWDNDTTYASYNGGKYNFVSDRTTGCAVPDDQHFWTDLFNTTQAWGKFILYEQDWLNAETDRNLALQSDLDLGRRWLVQMGKGASKFGVTIQYCMSYSRHILQSLEIPAVTQARVSDDYQPGNEQWKIGITSMFTDALNLAPSKDTFWTSDVEPGNRYNQSEKSPYLQALVATLSTGPVGPGDGIGFLNSSLLKKCCDSSGRILRASRPLTIMDKSLKKNVFGFQDPTGRSEVLYSTFSNISGHIFGIIVASNIQNTNGIVPTDLTPDYVQPKTATNIGTYIYSDIDQCEGWIDSGPLWVLRGGCVLQPCVYYSTPIFEVDDFFSFAFVGEVGSKFAPVSPQRFSDLRAADRSHLSVRVNVNPGETVKVWFLAIQRGKGYDKLAVTCDNGRGQKPVSASAQVWKENQEVYYKCVIDPAQSSK